MIQTVVPLVAEHDSWITVDPVLGCPVDCLYCYLGPLGLKLKRPAVRASPNALAMALKDYLFGRRSLIIDPASDQTPICIGNYTDMVLSRANQARLIGYVERIATVVAEPRPLVVVTKGAVPASLVAALDRLGWPIYWFFSQSLAGVSGRSLEYGPVADLHVTLANARRVSCSRFQRSVHFWRPFVPELRLSGTRLAEIIVSLRDAPFECSVVVGLKRGPGVPLNDPRLAAVLGDSVTSEGSDEVFDDPGWREASEVAVAVGYALHRDTASAIAAIGSTLGGVCRRVRLGGRAALPEAAAADGNSRMSLLQRPADVPGAVAKFLGVDPGLVQFNWNDRRLFVAQVIDEFDYNTLRHGLGAEVAIGAVGVRRQKAWLGAHAGRL